MKPILLGFFLRRIGAAVFLLWVGLCAMLVFFELLRTADDGAFASVLFLTLMKSPQMAMDVLPFACAIGCALAMRRMVADGEMPTLRTSGLSPTMIVCFQVIAALPFVAVYLLLSEVLLPTGADVIRSVKNDSGAVHGLWLADGDDYIRVESLDNVGTMREVVIYHTKEGALTGITRAERARFDGDAAQWQLFDVERVDASSGVLSEQAESSAAWGLPLQPSSFTSFTQPPREMALHEAMHAAAELTAAGQYNRPLQTVIWQRWLTLPGLLLLVAFGIGFIGGDRRLKYAISLPLLVSAVAAGVYFIAREVAVQSAVINDSPLPLLLPPLIFAAAVYHNIRRISAV